MRRIRTMNSKKVLKRRMANKRRQSKTWDIIHEDGREVIQQWRDKRIRLRGARKSYKEMLVYSFDLDTLRSFLQNINFMVILQIFIAIIAVFIFNRYDIYCDIPINLFVAPIVFPLAFSINTDFQRRERVLEDLASFKSSGMVWYFCMREWKEAAGLDDEWMTAAHAKLKSLIFHLHEYLLTHKPDRRKLILSVLYEDFSDASQLIEKIRASKLPANPAIVSKAVSLLHGMCASFERLRVVREYRSPRSIRSFNKVFITFLPIFLAPYFVYLERYNKIKIPKDTNHTWPAYYIAVVVAFVFSCLQGVQDKLDDPFDGMSEDDVNLDMIDEWVNGSLVHIMGRMMQLGGYTTSFDEDDVEEDSGCCQNSTTCNHKTTDSSVDVLKREGKLRSSNNSNHLSTKSHESNTKEEPFVQQIFSSLLSRMKSSPPKLDSHLGGGGKGDDKNSLSSMTTHDVSKAIINTTKSFNIDTIPTNEKTDNSLVYTNENVLHPYLKRSYSSKNPPGKHKEKEKHVEKSKDVDYDTTLSDVSVSLSVETNNIVGTNIDKSGSFCIDIEDYVHDDINDCDQQSIINDDCQNSPNHNDYRKNDINYDKDKKIENYNNSPNHNDYRKNDINYDKDKKIENYNNSPNHNDYRKNNDILEHKGNVNEDYKNSLNNNDHVQKSPNFNDHCKNNKITNNYDKGRDNESFKKSPNNNEYRKKYGQFKDKSNHTESNYDQRSINENNDDLCKNDSKQNYVNDHGKNDYNHKYNDHHHKKKNIDHFNHRFNNNDHSVPEYDQHNIKNSNIQIHKNKEMEESDTKWGVDIRTSNNSSPTPQYSNKINSRCYNDRNPFKTTPSIQITPSIDSKISQTSDVKLFVQEID